MIFLGNIINFQLRKISAFLLQHPHLALYDLVTIRLKDMLVLAARILILDLMNTERVVEKHYFFVGDVKPK